MSIKKIVKNGIVKCGLLRLKQFCLPKTVLVLYFHSVSDRWDRDQKYIPGISVLPETFQKFMRLLRDRYQPVRLDDIVGWLEHHKEIPPRAVAVTFDDGFEDNDRVAAPIMEEFGIRATFYLTSSCVEHQTLPWFAKMRFLFSPAYQQTKRVHDSLAEKEWQFPQDAWNAFVFHTHQCACMSWNQQLEHIAYLETMLEMPFDSEPAPRMMTWEMARELIQRGHCIGNHTYSHPNVAHISEENRQIEIVESHRLLEKKLGQAPEHFSYPHPCLNPQHDVKSDETVRSLGYQTIVLTKPGWIRGQTSPFALPRLPISEMSLEEFHWKLETAFAGIEV